MTAQICDVRFPPKADIAERNCDVRFVPKADISGSTLSNAIFETPVLIPESEATLLWQAMIACEGGQARLHHGIPPVVAQLRRASH